MTNLQQVNICMFFVFIFLTLCVIIDVVSHQLNFEGQVYTEMHIGLDLSSSS